MLLQELQNGIAGDEGNGTGLEFHNAVAEPGHGHEAQYREELRVFWG